MSKKYIDIKLIKYLARFYTIITILLILVQMYWKSLGQLDNIGIPFLTYIYYNYILKWFAVLIFMIFVSYITKLMFERNWNSKLIIVVHLILSLVIQVFVFFTSISIIAITSNRNFKEFLPYFKSEYMRYLGENVMIYFSMLGIMYIYYYLKKIRIVEVQKSKLETQLVNSKLNMLKAQLNPHFVFNTLNSISSLVDIDKEKSQDMITNFGDLFRDILDLKDANLIPLSQELEMLEKYIDIISVRFEDHISFKKDINVDCYGILVPALLLQPIIENSVKHGYSLQITDIEICLKISTVNNMLIIIIDNSGKSLNNGLNDLFKTGLGLKNINERLETLYGEHFEFSMVNKENNLGVKTIIKIPIQ
ncbi:sensor histidine kinase [uncultured Psychroserpens sp.]|uniref:sensor histidine kinase n=1 Tax=uncultured Psychroserpens sp. TaxID=255436 RepID=UPI0026243924|nr:histidine kinase [uncultured Psychroserpens sp.]